MAPSQKSAENFNKKAEKKKAGIVSLGAAGMSNKGVVDPKDLRPKEMPCPHCERLFKQVDRLKMHVAKHHGKEVEEAAAEQKASGASAGAGGSGGGGGGAGGGGGGGGAGGGKATAAAAPTLSAAARPGSAAGGGGAASSNSGDNNNNNTTTTTTKPLPKRIQKARALSEATCTAPAMPPPGVVGTLYSLNPVDPSRLKAPGLNP
jgi:hypothetical protein